MTSKLEWAARAIAQPPAIQMTLFPSFVEVADELALAWEEAINEWRSKTGLLTAGQLASVEALDSYMESVSGPANLRVWTIDGLDNASEWAQMRTLAKSLLRKMGWQSSPPPPNDGLFIKCSDF